MNRREFQIFFFQDSKVLCEATLNPRVKLVEYAVRGPIVARALAIEKELQQVRGRCQQRTMRIIYLLVD